MGKRQQLTIILVFALLLAAGLNYTGRSMHRTLGGDKKYYTFLYPDLDHRQVIFCGRSYTAYQAENLWDSHKVALDDLWQAAPLTLLKNALCVLKDHLQPHWSILKSLMMEVWAFIISILKGRLSIPLP